nr:hypothetical protein [Pseudobdellovibrionaceae bacterium]
YSLDFGDRQGKPLIGKPGYFHVELKDKPQPSLVINIAKVVNNQVDKAKLQDLIKKSQFLSKAELLQSNEDGSQTFIFNIKQNTPVKVFQVKSKKGASKMIFEVGQKSRVR